MPLVVVTGAAATGAGEGPPGVGYFEWPSRRLRASPMTLQRPLSQPTRRDDLLARQAVEALEGAGTPLPAPDLASRLGAPRGRGYGAASGDLAHVLQRLSRRWPRTNASCVTRRPVGIDLAGGRRPASPLLALYAVLEVTAPSAQASAVRLAGVRLRTGQIVDPYFAQFVPQEEAASPWRARR